MAEQLAHTVDVTEADRRAAQDQVSASARGVLPAGIAIAGVLDLIAVLIVDAIAPSLDGFGQALTSAAVAVVLSAPLLVLVAGTAKRRAFDRLVQTLAQDREMKIEARRREFETRLANALDMADTEPEALDAAARGLRRIVPEERVEVLLADNSHAHLERALVLGPDADGPGCPVESPQQCVAARRGQTQMFADSDHLDTCPKLRDRLIGRCTAVCVPLSVMGRSVGVVHLAAPLPAKFSVVVADELEILANQVGGRLGMLRVMAESQIQAGTDALTGLPNRRTFESRVRVLRQSGIEDFTVILADLDHFKQLNDTFGHETGDRALRTFATVLRSSLRPTDIFCRYGGEEFAIVLPGCMPDDAVLVCARVREELGLAVKSAESPSFTVSFGVAAASADLSLDQIMSLADGALYEAKGNGRDRTEVHRDGIRTAPGVRTS